ERNPVLDDQDDAELRADRHRAPEERLHRLRRRAGRHVEVEWLAPEELVAHASAREVRLVPGLAQPPHDPGGQCSPIGHRVQRVARRGHAGKRRGGGGGGAAARAPQAYPAYSNRTLTAPDLPCSPQARNASRHWSSVKRWVRMGVTSMRPRATRSR